MKTLTRDSDINGTTWLFRTENTTIPYKDKSKGLAEVLKFEALNYTIKASPKTLMTPSFLYKSWYDLYQPLLDETFVIGEPIEISMIDINKLACAYQYFFTEENKLKNIALYYDEFLEYKDFLKRVLDFDIQQFREDCPAAFV